MTQPPQDLSLPANRFTGAQWSSDPQDLDKTQISCPGIRIRRLRYHHRRRVRQDSHRTPAGHACRPVRPGRPVRPCPQYAPTPSTIRPVTTTRRWSVNRPSACRTPSRPVRSSSTTPRSTGRSSHTVSSPTRRRCPNDAVRVRAAVWPRRTGLPGFPSYQQAPQTDRRPMGIRPSRSPHGTIRAAARQT